MPRGCYSVERYRGGWSVSVFGAKVLVCESRKTALKVVRQATVSLCLDHGIGAPCREQPQRAWRRPGVVAEAEAAD
jgi:hypothetical protein